MRSMADRRLGIWAPLSPFVYARRPRSPLPYPLDGASSVLFAFARQGIWHGCRALGLEAGDSVLVPAYHHGSEVEALARAGLVCRFYDGVRPYADELEALIDETTRALYLIHPVGLPQDAAHWRRWCDERALLLIEDAAQAWLARVGSRPAGAYGDLGVFCMYKTVGVPEGAAAVARCAVPAPSPNTALGVRDLARRHGAWLAQRSSAVAWLLARRRAAPYSRDRDMALGDVTSGPWRLTSAILSRVADPTVAARRRANFRLLEHRLGDLVPEELGPMTEGASPFVFPVAVTDRQAELRRLAACGIRALDLWSVPHPSLPTGYPRAEALRREVIGLPVHQELHRPHIERIARAVRAGGEATGSVPAGRATVEPAPELGDLQGGWNALAVAREDVFATWDWATLWLEHFGAGRRAAVGVTRDGAGNLRCVVPLHLRSYGPVSVARFLGDGVGDHAGPVCRPGDEAVAADAVDQWLGSVGRCDLLYADRMAGDTAWGSLLGGTVVARRGSPVLDVAGRTWEDILGDGSRNFRQQVRRYERRLMVDHDVTYRLADDPDRLDADLETLFRLHRARWGGHTPFSDDRRAFHVAFARRALDRGWLRLWLLEVDGVPVAAHHGFRIGAAQSYYQAGRVPAWDSYHVGFVLLAHVIREAVGSGVQRYELLQGGDPYKQRFATRDPGLDTVIVPRTAPGRAVAGGAAIAGFVPPDARRAVRRALRGERPGACPDAGSADG